MPSKIENFSYANGLLKGNGSWGNGITSPLDDWVVEDGTVTSETVTFTADAKHPTFFNGFTLANPWAVRLRIKYNHPGTNYAINIFSIGGPVDLSGQSVLFGLYPDGAGVDHDHTDIQWGLPDQQNSIIQNVPFPWDVWVDLVVRWNAGVVTFYTNGTLVGTTETSGVLAFDDTQMEMYAQLSGVDDPPNNAYWEYDYVRAYSAVPSAPTIGTATATGTTTIDLTWTDAANSDFVIVQRSPAGAGTWTTLSSSITIGTQTYSDSGLSAGTAYDYRVKANNAMGDSAASSTASATTSSPAPTDPSGLIATTAGATSIDLSWTDNSSNETSFDIERSLNGSDWSSLISLDGNVTAYSDTGLEPLTKYYYRVKADNSGSDSGYTNTANATTGAAATHHHRRLISGKPLYRALRKLNRRRRTH